MIRKHGWQLPAHKYQVVAITVFCLLVITFYAFLAPFLGGLIWKYTFIGVYTPVVLTVFILYVRCTAINPADPGINFKINSSGEDKSNLNNGLPATMQNKDETVSVEQSSSSSVSVLSLSLGESGKKGSIDERVRSDNKVEPSSLGFCRYIGGFLCVIFNHEDCRKADQDYDQQNCGEEALFCTLCNTEVQKLSKHCRSCDKCVDGFDHHCRWLNNCVGSKNYYTFIALMAASLIWLILEAGVGIAVFVRCFVEKKSMNSEIVENLGNGFSRALFAVVVGISTAVSILACVPLGELFFFHMILIRKGISTYEYVVAMRTVGEGPTGAAADEEQPSVPYSPTGSATTGFSAGSSHGLSYKGAWCTPPRIFVDYQEEVVPHLDPGMIPSTVDPDAAGDGDRGSKAPKKPVRISAWKLAKLDSGEAMKAAAKARASSSVLKPVGRFQFGDRERSSSDNMSVRSSISTDLGMNKESKSDAKMGIYGANLASRDDYDTGTQSASSFSSPVHESASVSPPYETSRISRFKAAPSAPRYSDCHPSSSILAHSSRDIPQSGSTSGFRNQLLPGLSTSESLFPPAPTSHLRDIKRTSVVWDQEAGRYVSVPVSAYEARNKSAAPTGSVKQIPPSRSVYAPHESSSSGIKNPGETDEKLWYTGDSIFFGGPLLNPGSGRGLLSKEAHSRMSLSLPRETRYKRDATSNQLPVFVPGGLEHNSMAYGK